MPACEIESSKCCLGLGKLRTQRAASHVDAEECTVVRELSLVFDNEPRPDQCIQRYVDQPSRRALMLQRREKLKAVEPTVGASAIEAETASLAEELRLGGTQNSLGDSRTARLRSQFPEQPGVELPTNVGNPAPDHRVPVELAAR